MKHQAKRYKLGRTTNHRASLWYNLVRSLALHGRIVTTDAKAKSMIPIAEKLVTLAKDESLSAYRSLIAQMRGDETAAKKLREYGEKFKDRNGGYISIVKIGQRKGDAAHQSCVMFVENN
jgi:large subunit ribosomal protein L17